MLKNILTAISVGRQLLQARAEYKSAMPAEPKGPPPVDVMPHLVKIDALAKKAAELELIAHEQASRISDLENTLSRSQATINALTKRVGINFWMGLSGLVLGMLALALVIFLRLS